MRKYNNEILKWSIIIPKLYCQQLSCDAGLLLFLHFAAISLYKVETLGTKSQTDSIKRNGKEPYFSLLKRHFDFIPAEKRLFILSTCPDSAEKMHRGIFTTQGEKMRSSRIKLVHFLSNHSASLGEAESLLMLFHPPPPGIPGTVAIIAVHRWRRTLRRSYRDR